MSSKDMKHIGLAMADALKILAAKYSMAAKTESPIETILGAEIKLLMEEVLGDLFAVGPTGKEADFTLVPQYKLHRFRYDFALCVKACPYVLIECDGKDYHSTDAQIMNDERKDMAASDAELQIRRYSGSLINALPKQCALDAVRALLFQGKVRGDFE